MQDKLLVSVGQYSSAGRKAQNQDFHGAALPDGAVLSLKGIVIALADGISSSPVSRQAAETAVGSLMTDYYATPDAWTVKNAASRVIQATSSWLHAQSRHAGTSDMNQGLVCTLSALILKGRDGHIFHVGDSRICRLAGESLEPLTQPHRVTLSPEQSYLGRAMGAQPEVEIDYRKVALRVGDVFLLTTDGIHETLSDRHLARLLADRTDLDALARRIADEALDRGSDDNLTVQVLRIDSLPAAGQVELMAQTAQLPIPPLPKAGDVIDGFRILRPLHQTARSHVFLAGTEGGAMAALKIPSTEHQKDAAYLGRFVLEEWIARRLSSPHVIKAAPLPQARSVLFVATEFVEGQTLRQWMTDTPHPDLQQVRDIVQQISIGLRAFHRREMLHQDIRPENILIDRHGTVKIIDLGSTSVAGVEEAAPGTLGEMPGTFQYTAPEYLSGDAVSWRSDQYALGVIAYEMLTGRLPYGTAVAQVRSRADQRRLTYRPARDDDRSVPDWIDDALRRATHPDPLRRYDALTEFVADLRRPGPGWRARKHVPLAQRDPLRFWQALCVLLVVALALVLANPPG
ncbi:MAG: bifunctional protein-serine/threonine kinase/phosphatase [Rhodobacteraceae bacterium]|nr:bifunctional protein-serine/threonine kinase/phosphatase [Paracoccaceae bacterium]